MPHVMKVKHFQLLYNGFSAIASFGSFGSLAFRSIFAGATAKTKAVAKRK